MVNIMKKIEFNFPISDKYTYHVTKDGRVFKTDIRNDKISECYYHVAHGYKRIRVTDISCNTRRYLRVGRLVAITYIENTNSTYNIINHIDGNKQNDSVENLEWCNTSINTKHAYDNGLVLDRGGWKSTPYDKRKTTR